MILHFLLYEKYKNDPSCYYHVALHLHVEIYVVRRNLLCGWSQFPLHANAFEMAKSTSTVASNSRDHTLLPVHLS